MKYVLAFAASEFVNFRQIEFNSLCQLGNIKACEPVSQASQDRWSSPYVVVHLKDDEEVFLLIQRSILIKAVFHLWCEASSFEELQTQIPFIPAEFTDKHLRSSSSYKLIVSSANRKLAHEEKLRIIEDVLNAHSGMTAIVKLQNPDCQLNILLDYAPRNWVKGQTVCGAELRHVFYGRLVGTSRRKELMNSYRLADRAYLGNTTMDVRLAAIMANAGLCERGTLVWDPFLGTGSIVLAASVWGALGGGSDIDYALLHGMGMSPKAGQGKRRNDECLRTSYSQYGLQSNYLDVVVADAASLHRLFRIPVDTDVRVANSNTANHHHLSAGVFDVILTDPPYGVRQSSRRIAGQVIEREPSLVTPERFSEITGAPLLNPINENGDSPSLLAVPHDLPHFPHKEVYPLDETFFDLLTLSYQLLRPGGRLVFWIPMNGDHFVGPHSFPKHNGLQLVAACEQILNRCNSRCMVVMRKLYPDEVNESDSVNLDKYFPADRMLCCR